MAMIGKVLRMHHRENKSVREIVRATSLARNTVRKYLRGGKVQEPRYRRETMPTKLGPFVQTLEQALLADARRPKKERRTARALHKQLREAGYQGGYTRLTDFIRQWRAQQGSVAIGKAYVPLAFELGEAFQFDWSEEGLVVGGIYRRLQVAHMKLCASRAFWLVAYPGQGHEMLFDAHTRGFAALGGVARRGIYDNMKTAVDKVKKGKGRIVNARFAVMCAHYLFDADFCNVASGWEKGASTIHCEGSGLRGLVEAAPSEWHIEMEIRLYHDPSPRGKAAEDFRAAVMSVPL
jgi:transposase